MNQIKTNTKLSHLHVEMKNKQTNKQTQREQHAGCQRLGMGSGRKVSKDTNI